jgi:cellulose synthase/poly-beta-1,6-N-acetylglucosamine synthase-like glycosyltransferase
MMFFWQYLFLISCFLVFYNYAGYALIAYIVNRINKPVRATREPGFFPRVSFLVAAYNEADFIENKILNSLQQDYPGAIEFLFVTDGSDDGTPEIVQRMTEGHPGLRLLHLPERKGKSAAMDRAVKFATGDILIFSDANTLLNKEATSRIVRHYANPLVGGVAGEKKVISSWDNEGNEKKTGAGNGEEVGAGEGLYWKYESFLKKIDSDFYSVVGAAGELFSLRKDLYEPLSPDIILDDFVLSLKVAQKGYRVRYEPDAYAMELPSFSLNDEQKRKVRIAAGGFQSIVLLSSLLFFWQQPKLSFLYISHRVLRWAVTPFCLVIALISNFILCLGTGHILYYLFFAAQLAFYGMAALAALMPGKQPKILKLPYYFTFMNISVIWGFFRFLRGRQSSVWEKAKRTQN